MASGSTDDTTVAGVTPTPLAERTTASAVASHEFAEEPGTFRERYVVLEEVGRGGMGRVLRAYDPKLQREVALKQLRRSKLGSVGTARLVAEARAMAKLSHANVVAVFDVEAGDGDDIALVMEYVSGSTLQGWLDEQPRDWTEIAARYIEAGRGLAAAHRAGLLHRDQPRPGKWVFPVEQAGRELARRYFGAGCSRSQRSTSSKLPACSAPASGHASRHRSRDSMAS